MMKLRSTIGFKQWRDFLSIYNYNYYVVTSGFSQLCLRHNGMIVHNMPLHDVYNEIEWWKKKKEHSLIHVALTHTQDSIAPVWIINK